MSNKTGDWAQGYWEGKPSRKEIQKPFDELGKVINGLTASMSAYNLTMQFVMEKLGVQQQEFETWANAKTAQMQTAAEAQQVADEASKPQIVIPGE